VSWGDVPSWAHLVAQSILNNVKVKDPFTFYHCARVGRGARKLAQAMGLNEYDQIRLEFAGLFHDIGKVGVPDNILLKPGKLTQPEFETMKSHSLMSAAIIEPMKEYEFFKSLLPGIRAHHERIDGFGYPYGMQGEQIPLSARIISVIDSVDAMMNTRPYRQALSFDIVKKELVDFSGRQFDQSIVKIYLDAVRFWKDLEAEEPEDQVVHHILKTG
jgi:HD-GYP domain-containing protein (c-di-GMP phosphodiesterase class II)